MIQTVKVPIPQAILLAAMPKFRGSVEFRTVRKWLFFGPVTHEFRGVIQIRWGSVWQDLAHGPWVRDFDAARKACGQWVDLEREYRSRVLPNA